MKEVVGEEDDKDVIEEEEDDQMEDESEYHLIDTMPLIMWVQVVYLWVEWIFSSQLKPLLVGKKNRQADNINVVSVFISEECKARDWVKASRQAMHGSTEQTQ